MPDLLQALKSRPAEGPFGVFDGNRPAGVEDFRFLLARLSPEDQSLVYRVREGALPLLLGEGHLYQLEHLDAGAPFEGRRYGFTLRTLALPARRDPAPGEDPTGEQKAPPPAAPPLPPAPPPAPSGPRGGTALVPGLMLLLFLGLVVAVPLVLYIKADRYVDEDLAPRIAAKLHTQRQPEDAALAVQLARLDKLQQLDSLQPAMATLKDDLETKNAALADSLRKQQGEALAPLKEDVKTLLKATADLPANWDGKQGQNNQTLVAEIDKRLGKPRLEQAVAQLEDELVQVLPVQKATIETAADHIRKKFELSARDRRSEP